jgi:hypothetical protein
MFEPRLSLPRTHPEAGVNHDVGALRVVTLLSQAAAAGADL